MLPGPAFLRLAIPEIRSLACMLPSLEPACMHVLNLDTDVYFRDTKIRILESYNTHNACSLHSFKKLSAQWIQAMQE